jgi:hypothetical protein
MKGLLLKESLDDCSPLDLLHVVKTELWQVSNAAEFQSGIWTAISFEVEDRHSDAVAGVLSRALKTRGWYINASSDLHVYVIFPNQVFKYPKGDITRREAAKRFARTIDIPESQLDWDE